MFTARPFGKAPVLRYERQRPGELLHIDSKKLARIDGLGHRITGDRTSRTRGRRRRRLAPGLYENPAR